MVGKSGSVEQYSWLLEQVFHRRLVPSRLEGLQPPAVMIRETLGPSLESIAHSLGGFRQVAPVLGIRGVVYLALLLLHADHNRTDARFLNLMRRVGLEP